MRNTIILFLVSIILILSCQTGATENTEDKGNQNFHEPLSISIDNDYAPQTLLNVDGKPAGLLVDIWKLWSKKTGKEIVFISGEWKDTLSYLKTGQASIHSGLFFSDSRSQWMSFSQPFFGVGSYIFYSSDSTKIDIMDKLSGIKIGATKGSFQEEYIKMKYPEAIVVPFTNREKMIRSVLSMRIDCLLAEGHAMEYIINRLGMSGNFKMSPQLFKRTFHAGVLKQNTELLKLVDNGFNAISDSELAEIEERWISDPKKQYYRNQVDKIRLTDIEKTWISDHPTIRVGFPSNFPPLFYNEDGVVKGISPDHLKLISTYSGIDFDFITIPAKELNISLENGTIDMSVGFEIPERKNIALNTLSSMTINIVIVGRNDMPVVSSLSAMKGDTIAIVRGINIYTKILKEYPSIQTYPANSLSEALEAVVSKKADALMGSMLMVGYLLHKYPSLKILGPVGAPPEPYVYLVGNEFPELVNIIDKTIKIIPKEDVDAIIQKWFKVQIEQKTDWVIILKWGGTISIFFITIIFLFYYWNKKLKLEIRERKQAEQSLKDSEERFRSFFNYSPLGLNVFDMAGKVVAVNNVARKFFGVSETDPLTGYRFFEDRSITDETKWKVKHGQVAIEERFIDFGVIKEDAMYTTIKDKNDSVFIRLTYAAYGPDLNNPVGIIAIIQDFTERNQIEQSLKDSEERFRLAMQFANDGIFDWNLETNEIYYSPGWKRMLGYGDDELPNDFTVWESLTEPEDVKRSWKMQNELINKKRDRFEMEFKMKHKDGHWIDILSRANAIFDESNKAVRIIGTHVDISERKNLENQLLQSQKLESIGNLAGGIAHEFNNILSIIIGNNELIMEDLPEWSLSRESCEEIRLAGLRARDIVKHLLTFSRQDDSTKKPINMVSVVTESLKLIRSTTPTNIEIKDEISPNCLPILGDATQINQILINLCSNAIDALPISGGIIDIELRNSEVDQQNGVSAHKLAKGKYIKLIVRDNGSGIPQKILDRIFEPYFTTKDVGKGSGIGLAVVHGIIENHGGSITCESAKGEGTTFTILLPAYEGLVEEEREQKNTLPGKGERVLYVDDEPSIAKLGKRHLESLGYDAYSTTDPKKALEMIKAEPDRFDLVISDMAMPNMPGDQLIEQILSVNSKMPTMVCSGYSSRMSETTALEMGIKAFVMKPLNKNELAKKVREILDNGSNPLVK